MFASLKFTSDRTPPPDSDPVECVKAHPDLCTGILLFDILIGNCDRHEGNIAAEPPVSPKTIQVFDHDRALFGFYPKEGVKRLIELLDRLAVGAGSATQGNRHILLDALNTSDFIWDWVQRISQIPTWYIKEACSYVVGAGATKREANMAAEFLIHRRNRFPDIIADNKNEFKGISNWGLLP